jgi:hypothetical protein
MDPKSMMQIDHVSPLYYPVFISIKYLLAIQNYNFKRVPFGHIKNGQSRNTGNIDYTRHRTNKQTKTQHRQLNR